MDENNKSLSYEKLISNKKNYKTRAIRICCTKYLKVFLILMTKLYFFSKSYFSKRTLRSLIPPTCLLFLLILRQLFLPISSFLFCNNIYIKYSFKRAIVEDKPCKFDLRLNGLLKGFSPSQHRQASMRNGGKLLLNRSS